MRFKPALFAGLIAISSLCAADSFVGDWKVNLSKSEFGDSYKATGGRASYDIIEGGGYLYTSDTTFANGPFDSSRRPVQIRWHCHRWYSRWPSRALHGKAHRRQRV